MDVNEQNGMQVERGGRQNLEFSSPRSAQRPERERDHFSPPPPGVKPMWRGGQSYQKNGRACTREDIGLFKR